MPTALTGSLGWTGLHPVQLGGPPLVNTFDRKLPPTVPPQVGAESAARPFIGHLYQNDGVSPLGTFTVLNRPALTPTLANGGFNQILLEVAAFGTGAIYGVPIYGNPLYGGTSINVSQGNVVRLSEQGGDGSFVYGGVVEDIPETIGPSGVKHQILVSSFAVELDDTFSQAVYSAPTDVAQLVRDAVALTRHCSCDQVSCPAWTGIFAATTGQLDFRNQAIKQIIDTARSIAGPTWFWHVDELGRIWFQPMGSGAVYTIPRAQYEERTKSASIQNRKNKVVAVGGAPQDGSANVTAVADDLSSQGTIGIRALNPPLQVPHITDQVVLTLIASNILTVLNRTWQRVNLKVLPTYGRRIHASQPGGAMVRYWEPAVNPMQESSVGAGYSSTFIAQSLSNDGLFQQLVAGDIPVTSQNDVQNMVNSIMSRTSANALQVTAASLNLRQTLSGNFQSSARGTGLASPSRWVLDQTSLRVYDGTLNNYGAPSGVGVIAEFGANGQTFLGAGLTLQSALSGPLLQLVAATPLLRVSDGSVDRFLAGNMSVNGVSPAGYGFRVNDSGGNPLLDHLGPITGGVMASLGVSSGTGGSTTTSTTPVDVPGTPMTITVSTRPKNLLLFALFVGHVSVEGNTMGTIINPGGAGSASGSAPIGTAQDVTGMAWLYIPSVAVGSYTMKLQFQVSGGGITGTMSGSNLQVWQLGS